ncbi:hypothetical protein PR048_013668 [Dryococelus australis]|uniref:Uncharacterized protein n=1 Tax=Dryococelus australis TaxID=614101 RepID=A0ABQ9HUD0_9NEOP|nr:hypothetical protein PR048_013668 [Dryococelus australis]
MLLRYLSHLTCLMKPEIIIKRLSIKAFENYIRPRRNVPYARSAIFSEAKRGEANLKTLMCSCEFGDQTNDIIRDCLFMGVCGKILQKEILETQHLTLERACELATKVSSKYYTGYQRVEKPCL